MLYTLPPVGLSLMIELHDHSWEIGMEQVSIHGAEKNVFKIFNDEYAFTIPLYQRPYSWTTEHAGELLEDFLGFIRNEGNVEIKDMKPYFLGSIVLIKGDNPESKIGSCTHITELAS
jgi:hypothetical protein